jgi:undecaprenyl-diphosphatase
MDREILDFVVRNRPDWMVEAAKFLHHAGDDMVLVPLTLALLVVGMVAGRRTAATVAPAVSMVLTVVVVGLAKSIFGRGRPPAAGRLVEVTSASMPSGHAAYAAAIAGVVWVLLSGHTRRAALRMLAVAVAACAALARLVLGVHWPSDVVAGAAVGAVVGTWVARVAVQRLQSQG